MLADVKPIVAEGHLGIRTYEDFVQACLERAAAGGADAVGLFVLAKIVQPFADYYRDQPLSEADAVAFRRRLLAHIKAIDEASGAEARLAALGGVIRQELAATAAR